MMPWRRASLSSVGVALYDCEHRTPAAASTGLPYVAIPQIKEGRLDLSDARLISRDDFADWTRKTYPRADDVIVVRRCNSGETAAVPPGIDLALGQNLVILRATRPDVAPPFLRWLLRGPEWWEQVRQFLNVGAVFDSLKCADIPRFELTIPPRAHQDAIAAILGALDDKIELNRRTNETLEAMARALFQSWFVDFDPVRAKMEGRQPEAMDAETASLFPDALVDSQRGPMPTTWKLAPVTAIQAAGKYACVAGPFGSNLTSRDYVEHGVPVIRGSNLSLTRFWMQADDFVYVSEAKADELTGNLAFPGDVVLTQRGTLGQVGVIPFDAPFPRYVLSQSQMKIAVDLSRGSPAFMAMYFQQPSVIEFIIANGQQAGVPHINLGFLRALELALPPSPIARAFEAEVQPLLQRVRQLENEAKSLTFLRDALLPMLLSGELRIPDAERAVSAAL